MVKTLPLHEALKNLSLPGLERNLFSSVAWLAVVYETYKLKLFVKYIERGGKIASYIIYSVVSNFLENKICICSYCDYFDCYVSSQEDWEAFFDSLHQEYPRFRITVRNLRDMIVRQNLHFQVLSKERFHIIDVRPSLDLIWKNMYDAFRRAVKQSQKSGVTARVCGKSELYKFYDLHLRLRKNKYRLFPQPFKFFDYIWKFYMEEGKGILLGAYDQKNRFIAGTVYLQCGNTFYYKFNTSDLNYLPLRSNNLLVWEGIKIAKERNLEYLDLGSSGYEQKGLVLFKNHTGAACYDIFHLGYTPLDYRFSRKVILSAFTKFCTHPWMPNAALRWGSHLIYPYLA